MIHAEVYFARLIILYFHQQDIWEKIMQNGSNSFYVVFKGKSHLLIMLLVLFLLMACGEPTGMDVTFVSDTPVAYEETMSRLEGQLTAIEYQQLKRAINYINMNTTEFDSLNDFRASLNGLTPAKIVAQAEALKQSKQQI